MVCKSNFGTPLIKLAPWWSNHTLNVTLPAGGWTCLAGGASTSLTGSYCTGVFWAVVPVFGRVRAVRVSYKRQLLHVLMVMNDFLQSPLLSWHLGQVERRRSSDDLPKLRLLHAWRSHHQRLTRVDLQLMAFLRRANHTWTDDVFDNVINRTSSP